MNDKGFPEPVETTLAPGSTGQVKLTFLAKGSYAGEYDFEATPKNPEVASATLSPSSANVSDGEPVDVLVSITLADTAEPSLTSHDGDVGVSATMKGEASDNAYVLIIVRIAE